MRPMGQQSVVEVSIDPSRHLAETVVHEARGLCHVN